MELPKLEKLPPVTEMLNLIAHIFDRIKLKRRKERINNSILDIKQSILELQDENPLTELADILDIDTKTTEAKKSHDAARIVQDLDNLAEDDVTYVDHTVLALNHAAAVMSDERLPILFAKILNKSAQKELEKGNLDISAGLLAEAERILKDRISSQGTTKGLSDSIRYSIPNLIKEGQIPVSKFISSYAAEIAKKEVHGKEPSPGAPGASGV